MLGTRNSLLSINRGPVILHMFDISGKMGSKYFAALMQQKEEDQNYAKRKNV